MLPPPDEAKNKRVATVKKSFNRDQRKELNIIIAMLFYSSGLPFNLARNMFYTMTLAYAANNPLPGISPRVHVEKFSSAK